MGDEVAVAVAGGFAVAVVEVRVETSVGLCDSTGVGDAAGLAAHPNPNDVNANTITAAIMLNCIAAPLRKMHQSRAVAAAFPRFRLKGAGEWMAGEVFAHSVA